MYGANHPRSLKKQSYRDLRRQARAAISSGSQALLILIACLAQKGGEIVVTQGTIDQCSRRLGSMDFEIVDGETKGEFVVRLLEGKEVAA